MNQPLMPMATAVWLVDNTGLTFRQIGRFCGLHELEVQAIADETVGQHIVGIDPTLNGQLTWDEIKRCQEDDAADLTLIVDEVPAKARTKGPRYTPVSKRQDKPDAIAWLVRNHPEMSDGQIGKLIGTTKPTIQAIRDRTHWNISNITPNDPVGLGLCSQIELDDAVRKAVKKQERANKKAGIDPVADAEKEEAKPSVFDVIPTSLNESADEAPTATAEEEIAEEAAAHVSTPDEGPATAAESRAAAEALFASSEPAADEEGADDGAQDNAEAADSADDAEGEKE